MNIENLNFVKKAMQTLSDMCQPGYDDGEHVHRRRGRIETLETIRVAMVLWIIQHHFMAPQLFGNSKEESLGQFWGTISRGLTLNNQAACYAFISLSGFVTHWTSRHTDFSGFPMSTIPAYCKRHLGRIFFSYEAACLMGYLVTFPGFCPARTDIWNHNKQAFWSFTALQSWFGLYSERVSFNTVLYINPPLWTISSLFFCWLMYPIYSILLVRKKNLLLAGCGVLFWSVFMYGAFTRWPGPDSPNEMREGPWQGWYWFPPLSFPTFIVGVYMAEISAKLNIPKHDMVQQTFWGTIGCASFFAFMWLNAYDSDMKYLGVGYQYVNWFRLFLCLLPVVIAAAGSESFILGSVLCYPLQKLGEYALAMYVFQSPVMSLVKYAISGEVKWWPAYSNVAHFALGFAVLTLFSVCFVEFVEKTIWGFDRSADEIVPLLGK